MRFKLVLLFLLTVLIPTILLVRFSILAVLGEKWILERNTQQKYRSMARIVNSEIETSLKEIPKELWANLRVIEPLLLRNTQLFEGEVMIFDLHGKAVDGLHRKEGFGAAAFLTPVNGLPFEIAVYERNPEILGDLAKVTKQVSTHFVTVAVSALAILLGGLFTLGRLFREWGRTEIKAEFMSHLVHDLRRPLTSIRMFSEMLENDRVPGEEKRREYYRIIGDESEKLINLANNVLDFSRIESGTEQYAMHEEDLVAVVSETIARFEQSHMASQPRRIVPVLPSSLPRVRMNAESISQALTNLLSNAVKYSPAGSEIRVVLSRDGKRVHLSVIDQGLGIPRREQKRIFRKYYRGEDAEVRNREGSGLGLAIVQYAVMAHRGKIKIKSEEGEGSEFTIALPIG
ncbi:MAG: hypothetical protein HYU99_10380 [Deltaproteobacteria bacterium]|nr:hypothetical protein [Deltaproteobacteria bacterium]